METFFGRIDARADGFFRHDVPTIRISLGFTRVLSTFFTLPKDREKTVSQEDHGARNNHSSFNSVRRLCYSRQSMLGHN